MLDNLHIGCSGGPVQLIADQIRPNHHIGYQLGYLGLVADEQDNLRNLVVIAVVAEQNLAWSLSRSLDDQLATMTGSDHW